MNQDIAYAIVTAQRAPMFVLAVLILIAAPIAMKPVLHAMRRGKIAAHEWSESTLWMLAIALIIFGVDFLPASSVLAKILPTVPAGIEQAIQGPARPLHDQQCDRTSQRDLNQSSAPTSSGIRTALGRDRRWCTDFDDSGLRGSAGLDAAENYSDLSVGKSGLASGEARRRSIGRRNVA